MSAESPDRRDDDQREEDRRREDQRHDDQRHDGAAACRIEGPAVPEDQAALRALVPTAVLVRRMSDYAMGEIELSREQLRAIEALLRKTLPDLTSERKPAEKAMTHEEWLEELE
jgi:hypothetical protein